MRQIDADALMESIGCADAVKYGNRDRAQQDTSYSTMMLYEIRNEIDAQPTVGGWISVKEVANIIADLFGDGCACNSNDIDEWLPQYCEYRDTDCPHPPGVACWEQYLKHLDKKPNGGG
jgi:hypothetical protein